LKLVKRRVACENFHRAARGIAPTEGIETYASFSNWRVRARPRAASPAPRALKQEGQVF